MQLGPISPSPPNGSGGDGEIGPNCTPSGGAYCNDGSEGEGCETNSACQGGLVCATSLDLLGVVAVSTCSECDQNSDCGNQLCTPVVDVGSLSGQMECRPPGSLPQNAFCHIGDGDATCASGSCSEVDIMGIGLIGACGECLSDQDCGPGGICEPGEFNLQDGVLIGSTCEF
ncbi:MAG TPA: hypothetical protein VM869_13160 [Enhygromyxa sp.]|nr:hypothetical protein [Enhygromyxa sp.]